MQQADHQPPTASVARRKLIRGAFAAPALMTVCSGSAFAVASNMRCIANAQNSPAPPVEWVSDVIDSYARVQLVMVQETQPLTTSSTTDENSTSEKEEVTDATVPDKHSQGTKERPPKSPRNPGLPPKSQPGTQPPAERYFVRGNDPVFSKFRVSNSISNTSQWQEIDISSYQPLGVPVDPPSGTSTLVEKYVIVRYDADGAIVGFGAGSEGAMASSACLFSAGIVES